MSPAIPHALFYCITKRRCRSGITGTLVTPNERCGEIDFIAAKHSSIVVPAFPRHRVRHLAPHSFSHSLNFEQFYFLLVLSRFERTEFRQRSYYLSVSVKKFVSNKKLPIQCGILDSFGTFRVNSAPFVRIYEITREAGGPETNESQRASDEMFTRD